MATNTIDYVLRIVDQGSSTLAKVSSASTRTSANLSDLSRKNKALESATKGAGNSIGNLQKRIEELRKQKAIIDPNNIKLLKQTNREMESLERQVDKLDRTGRRNGGMKSLFSDLAGGRAGRFLTNPLTIASAAVGFAGMKGASFDEGISKINVTAQLDPAGRDKMAQDIMDIVRRNKFDLSSAPEAFEQIISQMEEVDISMDIFEQTLRGAKGGFTDVGVVAGALAQTLSIVGKENASAAEVLDTFFASKRVGAGEFSHFATYMPSLIASADALGVGYKEVAGLYGYMTGKGQSPERAAVLMDNMFSMLGRGEIVDEMGAKGLNVHDSKGAIRPMLDIFGEMSVMMDNMTDKQRSSFLEDIGINRMEAKKAFMVMIADNQELAHSLSEVANSTGETDRALEFSKNTVQSARDVWNVFKGDLTHFGTQLIPIMNVGISVLGSVLGGVTATLSSVGTGFGWWVDKIKEGNPFVWALTTVVGTLTTTLAIYAITTKGIIIAQAIATAATTAWSVSMKALNASMLFTPWGLAIMGVAALAGGIAALSRRTDGATRSFAQFNAEVNRSQTEAKEHFKAAMQAAAGSDARAESIRNINDQYGSYLPSLLSEKSTNNDLSVALSGVNSQLERKFKLKYYNEAIGKAMDGLERKETDLYNKLLKGISSPSQQSQITIGAKGALEQLASGEIFPFQAQSKLLKLRKDISGKDAPMGFTNIGYNIMEYLDGAQGVAEAKALAGARYGINDNTPPPLGPPPPPPPPPPSPPPFLMGSGSSSNGWLDLDRLDGVNKKGSSTYGAIMSKIGRVGIAAAMVGGGMLSGINMPTDATQAREMPSIMADNTLYDDGSKTITMHKFCDKIEIHIASANGQGYDEIRSKIVEVLKEVVDG